VRGRRRASAAGGRLLPDGRRGPRAGPAEPSRRETAAVSLPDRHPHPCPRRRPPRGHPATRR